MRLLQRRKYACKKPINLDAISLVIGTLLLFSLPCISLYKEYKIYKQTEVCVLEGREEWQCIEELKAKNK